MILLDHFSFVTQARLHHVYHRQFVVLPHSIYDRVIFVENALSMELILLESALISLSVLEVLSSSTIKHAVVPITLKLSVATFSVQHSCT